jgi:hypothetical protein
MKNKQQVTEEKEQAHQKATQHTSPQERTRTNKHLNKNPKTEEFRRSSKTSSISSSRQLQKPNSKNMQQTNRL